MASEAELKGQFQSYNIEANTDVINKCMEMCLKYNLGAEDVVDEWFAFMSSNSLGTVPKVEFLERMERKVYMKPHKDQNLNKIVNEPEVLPVILTPKKPVNAPVSLTPQNKRLVDESLDIASSPNTPRSSYENRQNKKKICCSYRDENVTFTGHPNENLVIKPVLENNLKPNSLYMYDSLRSKSTNLDNITEEVIHRIRQKYNFKSSDDGSQYFGGRIASDVDDRLNEESILLDLIEPYYRDLTLHLNFSCVKKYAVFPGQIVVVKGEIQKNLRARKNAIIVQEIYTDGQYMFPNELPTSSERLQLVVACGPFTVQDNLSFAPLYDLLNYVKDHTPNVLILVGPFYDSTNECILNGELKQSFSTLFEEVIDTVMDSLKDTGVHVVIVSSYNEPHHYPVYPTPPYVVTEKYKNLTFTPDPSMININGLIIGITMADILLQIGPYEYAVDRTNPLSDRISRFVSHLLQQQNFYPLYPPHEDIAIDYGWMELYGSMPVKPHVLILTSKLRYFIKEIDECLVINPEKITKGYGGGTFARIEIQPGDETTSICSRTSCQILTI